tara:strand:- start:3671 stop:4975 length:1305 start_codon:yes stop_codon:yes gene_type:complete
VQIKIPLVIGLGITGRSLVNYLANTHKEIVIIEDSIDQALLDEIKQLNLTLHINPSINDDLFRKISTIYPSPGIPTDHDIFSYASKFDIEISSDIQEFIKFNRSIKILVTGTNGKTSTCLIIKSLFENFFPDLNTSVMGNIGEPVLDNINKNIDISIIEISSFQLELLTEIEFDIGLLLNIEEDHIDRHFNFENYKKIKYSVLKNSSFNISFDSNNLFQRDFRNYKNINLPLDFFESKVFKKWPIHDIDNLKASLAVIDCYCENFTSLTLKDFNVTKKLESAFDKFSKPPHRFEFLGNINGINFINDSKATNIDAMLKAIGSANEIKNSGEIHLICGGDLKHQNIASINLNEVQKVKNAIIYGKDKEIIYRSINQFVECAIVSDLKEAVTLAVKLSKESDYIMLSPACSSLDMYKDYAERGNEFKKIVSNFRYD